jgi:hypothetical protein
MLVMAHFLEIVGEHFCESITVGYRIVFAAFLSFPYSVAHLL